MSYTPPEQLLMPHIETILAGIMEFNKAVEQRVLNGKEWKQEHLDEINKVRKSLLDIQIDLQILK